MRNRVLRRTAALLALCALAFSQLALSAHACHRTAHESEPAVSAPAHADPCEGMQGPMNDTDSNVCDQHCNYGHTTLDKAQPPVAAFDSAAQPLRVATPSSSSSASRTAASLRRPAPAAAPPPALLFGVLRI